MSKKRSSEECPLNMTPMIDVVFQLIIFFIVTINISDAKDTSVQLEFGKDGQEVETGADANVSALIIDINKEGRASIANMTVREDGLRQILRKRFARQGSSFQVWIRGDYRTKHVDVRKVMDICSSEGIGRVTFLAVKDARTDGSRKYEGSVRARGR